MDVEVDHGIVVGRAGHKKEIKDKTIINNMRLLVHDEIEQVYFWMSENIKAKGTFSNSNVRFIKYIPIYSPTNFLYITNYLDNNSNILTTGFNCIHCDSGWDRSKAHMIFAHVFDVLKLWK